MAALNGSDIAMSFWPMSNRASPMGKPLPEIATWPVILDNERNMKSHR